MRIQYHLPRVDAKTKGQVFEMIEGLERELPRNSYVNVVVSSVSRKKKIFKTLLKAFSYGRLVISQTISGSISEAVQAACDSAFQQIQHIRGKMFSQRRESKEKTILPI